MAELYVLYEKDENGASMPIGYAYGDEWVAQALMMDDWRYNTPEDAKAAWERWKKEHG